MIPETLKTEIGKTFITCETYRCDMPINACIRRQKESRQNYFATLRETLILDPGCIRCEQGLRYSGLKQLPKPEKTLSTSDQSLKQLFFRKNGHTIEQKCSCCGEWKRITEYHLKPDNQTGYRRDCKKCGYENKTRTIEKRLKRQSASSGKN